MLVGAEALVAEVLQLSTSALPADLRAKTFALASSGDSNYFQGSDRLESSYGECLQFIDSEASIDYEGCTSKQVGTKDGFEEYLILRTSSWHDHEVKFWLRCQLFKK